MIASMTQMDMESYNHIIPHISFCVFFLSADSFTPALCQTVGCHIAPSRFQISKPFPEYLCSVKELCVRDSEYSLHEILN